MGKLSEEIEEISSRALEAINKYKWLATPKVYEREFIIAAQKLSRKRILKYLEEDEKNLEQQFQSLISEIRGVFSSFQCTLDFFDGENSDYIKALNRIIADFNADQDEEDGRKSKLFNLVRRLQESNRKLSESLKQLETDLDEKENFLNDIEILAQTDPLTQLLNRKVWDKQLHLEFERSKRYGRIFSIIMIDIDHFQRFNDFYGPEVGDSVLSKFSGILKEAVRTIDNVFRYGGEEFTVLLPETPMENAYTVAQRILEKINSTPFTNKKINNELKVTASIGIADSDGKESPDSIVETAEQALYLCKHSGRNGIRTSLDLV